MPEYFYSCVDCPEHRYKVNMRTGDIKDHCDHFDRNFTKSFPMRDTPCIAMLEIAEHECPVCGEVMNLVMRGKVFDHFVCKVHGEQYLKVESERKKRISSKDGGTT